jgi:hypothetical protein
MTNLVSRGVAVHRVILEKKRLNASVRFLKTPTLKGSNKSEENIFASGAIWNMIKYTSSKRIAQNNSKSKKNPTK